MESKTKIIPLVPSDSVGVKLFASSFFGNKVGMDRSVIIVMDT